MRKLTDKIYTSDTSKQIKIIDTGLCPFNLAWHQAKCPDCSETYIGETARRLEERVAEHAKKDRNSHLLRHARLKGHRPVSMDDFSILSKKL